MGQIIEFACSKSKTHYLNQINSNLLNRVDRITHDWEGTKKQPKPFGVIGLPKPAPCQREQNYAKFGTLASTTLFWPKKRSYYYPLITWFPISIHSNKSDHKSLTCYSTGKCTSWIGWSFIYEERSNYTNIIFKCMYRAFCHSWPEPRLRPISPQQLLSQRDLYV